MPLHPVELLRDLVAIPSVNPMGRPLSGPEFLETRLTEYLEQLFKRIGCRYQRQFVALGRENILARIDGELLPEASGGLLVFEAHQDTVPADGMTIEPFQPVIRGGRLYGRGSCDVKAGLAAMLAAFSRIAEQPAARRPPVVLAATVNEEHGFSGAECLAASFGSSPLLPHQPAAIVIAEPTELAVVVAHKGVLRWRCSTVGRATHSSQPESGENAIYKMARVVAALEHYNRDVLPTLGWHPFCGSPTLSVGTIAGGSSINTVPDGCTIEIDRRTLPGEDLQVAYEQAVGHVAKMAPDTGARHEPPLMQCGGLSNDDNGELSRAMAAAVEAVTGYSQLVGVPFGTNAATFAAVGVPCVVFGPGSIAQAHTADEWVSLEEVELATEILYRFCQSRSTR